MIIVRPTTVPPPVTTVVHVASSVGYNASSGAKSVTPVLPSRQSGDLMVIIVGSYSSGDISTPSGWTKQATQASAVIDQNVYTRVSTGSESNPTFTADAADYYLHACVSVFRNATLSSGIVTDGKTSLSEGYDPCAAPNASAPIGGAVFSHICSMTTNQALASFYTWTDSNSVELYDRLGTNKDGSGNSYRTTGALYSPTGGGVTSQSAQSTVSSERTSYYSSVSVPMAVSA